MNRRGIVLVCGLLALTAFAVGAYLYERPNTNGAPQPAASDAFTRPHSPIFGREDAPVTIVEFFDPACEACRAFYPIVKQILDRHPDDVRLVLRYAPFHEGSEEAVRILETARLQNIFQPVLEALLGKQPQWANHHEPLIAKAWSAAAEAGLNEAKARAAMSAPEVSAAIDQDVADGKALGVSRTPTFFVNGKPLSNFGPQQLYDLVLSEIGK
jgi:protein-disulfide isomerase